MWSRQLAEGKTEQQNGEERGYKWLSGARQGGLRTLETDDKVDFSQGGCCRPCPSLYGHSEPSFDGCCQQDKSAFQRAHTISNWYSNGLQSPGLGPLEHLWDVVQQLDSHHRWAATKSAAPAWCQHVKKCLRKALLNVHHKEWTQSCRQKGSNLLLTRCT